MKTDKIHFCPGLLFPLENGKSNFKLLFYRERLVNKCTKLMYNTRFVCVSACRQHSDNHSAFVTNFKTVIS